MRKRELEIALESLEGHPSPSPKTEQYATPAAIAADLLWFAYGEGDIAGRVVLDLGCGTGILAIGASLLGASAVRGIDSDPVAIRVARENARAAGASASFRVGDVGTFRGSADTVVMNPPFGAQRKHADLPFLEAAVRAAPVVYSFHNAATEAFVVRRLGGHGADVTHRKSYAFPITHRFSFHRKERRDVRVVALRSVRRAGKV